MRICYKIVFLQEEIDAAVSELLRLKAEYKNLTGEDVAGDGKGKKDKTKEAVKQNDKKDAKPSKKQEKTAQHANVDVDSGGKTRCENASNLSF